MMTTATPIQDQHDVVDVSPDVLKRWLDEGDAVVIDVREDFEHASERIPTAHHCALSNLDAEALRAKHGDQRLVFQCRTGRRSLDAVRQYCREREQGFHLAGGIEQWKQAGHATIRSASAPKLDVMRQVQMVAGSLVLTGVLLGAFASPWFLLLSGFVGAGLVFAGASGWCGMAKLLARMPWNRVTAG